MAEQVREIASRVRAIREIEGVSAESLARELSVESATYAAWEAGDADIPVGVLFEIAGRFKVDLAELITGEAPRLKTYCLTRAERGPEVARRSPYEYPRAVEFVAELPKTISGKIRRVQIREGRA